MKLCRCAQPTTQKWIQYQSPLLLSFNLLLSLQYMSSTFRSFLSDTHTQQKHSHGNVIRSTSSCGCDSVTSALSLPTCSLRWRSSRNNRMEKSGGMREVIKNERNVINEKAAKQCTMPFRTYSSPAQALREGLVNLSARVSVFLITSCLLLNATSWVDLPVSCNNVYLWSSSPVGPPSCLPQKGRINIHNVC